MKPPLLSVRDLCVSFRGSKESVFHAVQDLSFDLAAGETLALVGESGSGKSLTALSIPRLLPKNAHCSGSLLFDSQDLLRLPEPAMRALRGARIAMIFQEPMHALNPLWTVGAQIAESLRLHRRISKAEAQRQAIALLDEVGIPEPQRRVRSYPHELSGGQQQRVMIAMAMACAPDLLIADEPTTALDVTVQRRILALLKDLQARYGMSMLFITHDLGIVKDLADRVLVMRQGRRIEQGSVATLFAQPTHPYTQALLACRPSTQTRMQRLPVVEDFLDPTSDLPSWLRIPHTPVSTQPPVILEARHLRKTFPFRQAWFQRGEHVAVADISFALRAGQTLGVVGESGSGKSTLALLLMRLHAASAGELWFEGQDLLKLPPAQAIAYRRPIQMVFQNPYASLNPRWTVGHLLIEPLRIHGMGATHVQRQRMAMESLDQVGLPASAFQRYPHEFSGGQRQRVAIARALILKPRVLVCDESVSALDVSVQAQILNLLQALQKEWGLAYLFISHDLAVIRQVSDEVLVMKQGVVVEHQRADALYDAPLHPYTQALLAAVPSALSL